MSPSGADPTWCARVVAWQTRLGVLPGLPPPDAGSEAEAGAGLGVGSGADGDLEAGKAPAAHVLRARRVAEAGVHVSGERLSAGLDLAERLVSASRSDLARVGAIASRVAAEAASTPDGVDDDALRHWRGQAGRCQQRLEAYAEQVRYQTLRLLSVPASHRGGPSATRPAGAVPTGTVPTGAVPTGTLPTGTRPTVVAPRGRVGAMSLPDLVGEPEADVRLARAHEQLERAVTALAWARAASSDARPAEDDAGRTSLGYLVEAVTAQFAAVAELQGRSARAA